MSVVDESFVVALGCFDIGDPSVVVLDDKWCNCTGLRQVAVMVGLLRVRLSLFSSTDWQAMLGQVQGAVNIFLIGMSPIKSNACMHLFWIMRLPTLVQSFQER
ncbi:hypothetical protein GOBAR_DD26821 [Gossypium barbadense]|nr:hypothetical protein GOBAR_DD26821 [Gossypium barbadense]